MLADFAKTTHARNWTFATVDAVRAQRRATHEAAVARLSSSAADGDGAKPPPQLPPLDDLELLYTYYEHKLQEVCRAENETDSSRFTNHVLLAAHSFFKRFYLHVSPMEEDPKSLMLVALFLAGKVEQEKIQLADFEKHTQLKPEELLRLERRLLDVLRFQLVVSSPFRCLIGLLQDLHSSLAGKADAAGKAAETAAAELKAPLEALRGRAVDFLYAAMTTDAPLVYSPQQLALAALLASANVPDAAAPDAAAAAASALEVRGWMERRFAAMSGGGGGGGESGGGGGATALFALMERAVEACRSPFDQDEVKPRLKTISKSLKSVHAHAKEVERAANEKRLAMEAEQRRKRERERTAEDKEKDELMNERLRQAGAEAKAALIGGAAGDGVEAEGAEPFVLKKRRRTDADTPVKQET